jgi:hypothetical protein
MRLMETNPMFNGHTRHHAAYKITIGTSISILMRKAIDILLASRADKATRKFIRARALEGAERTAETARRTARLTANMNPQIVMKAKYDQIS